MLNGILNWFPGMYQAHGKTGTGQNRVKQRVQNKN